MATTPDIRIRLSAEGLNEVVTALKRVRDESAKTATETAKAVKAQQGVQGGFAEFGKAFVPIKDALGLVGIAVGIGEVTRAISGLLRESSQLARDLNDVSEQLGSSTAGTVGLAAAARITETDTARLKTGIVALSAATRDLGAGATTPATQGLKALGLQAKDFRGKDLADQFAVVAAKLAQVKDGQVKVNLAADIFGKKVGLELIPLLNLLGREGFEQVRQQLEKLFSPEAIARVAEMRAQFAILDLQVHGLALQFLSGLAPAVTRAVEVIDQELAGIGVTGMQRFGQIAGAAVAFVILKLDELVDHVLFATKAISRLALVGAQLTFGNVSLDTFKQLRAVLGDVEEGNKRAAERTKAFKEILSGKVNQAKPGAAGVGLNVPDPAVEASSERSRQLLATAKELAQAQLALVRSRIKIEEDTARRAFDNGLTAIRTYYAERRRIQQESLAAEIHAVRVQSTLELNEISNRLKRERSARETEIRTLEERRRTEAEVGGTEGETAAAATTEEITSLKLKNVSAIAAGEEDLAAARKHHAEDRRKEEIQIQQLLEESQSKLQSINDDERKAFADAGNQRAAIERRIADLRGDEHATAMADIDAEIKKAGELGAKLGAIPAATAGTVGALPAGVAGPEVPKDQVDIAKRIADLERLLHATRDFREELDQVSAAQRGFDQARSNVTDRVNLGLISQARGEREILVIETERMQRLRELSTALRVTASDTGNRDQLAEAEALDLEVQQIQLHLSAATDFGAKLAATFEDASRTGLADFLGRGIDQANGFRDAILGVLDALRQLASQALAKQITGFLAGLFGNAALPSGGSVPGSSGSGGTFLNHAQGGLVTARGTRARGFARGGLIRGPGGPTSDSIATWVPSGTYIVRASSVRAPGALVRLREMLRGSASYAGAAIAGGGAIPVRLSNGEFAVPPEVVNRPGMLAELERLNRGAMTPRLAALGGRGFADGGLAGMTAGVSGADGSTGSDGLHRVLLDLAPGLVAREVEEVMRSARGTRLVVETASRAPKSINRALGRG